MHQSHVPILAAQASEMTEAFPERDTLARYEPDLIKDALHLWHANSLLTFKNTVRELEGGLLTIPASFGSSDRRLGSDCLFVHFLAVKAHQVGGKDHYCPIKAANVSKENKESVFASFSCHHFIG